MGITGERIHLYAKIVAVADIFDAMTSERVYKKRMSPFYVFEMMRKNCFGVLDPEVMHVFLKNITAYYIGDTLKLNNGNEAEIVYINPMDVSRPIIRTDGEYIDLSTNHSLQILPY
jgi:HD-GYP domain-containing protein (c-di-GMP phosphodiesterase class II)